MIHQLPLVGFDFWGKAPAEYIEDKKMLCRPKVNFRTNWWGRLFEAYQDLLALWKDADADLPVLVEAKKEYEKLKDFTRLS